jgi:hypothetical protein
MQKSRFNVSNMYVTPMNPIPGQTTIIHTEYTVPKKTNITQGISKHSLIYNFMPFQPTVEPLCSNVPCPITPGHYKNNTVITWPNAIMGTFSYQITWFDVNNALLLCVDISGKGGSPLH